MTEDEAKATLCCGPPAVAAATYYGHGAPVDAPMHCIGSGCMAWRRGEETDDFSRRAEASFRRDGVRLTPTGSDIEGFCGLAGRP